MTHPTYTHPGANAALLALSRARRQVVLCRRNLKAWRGSPLEQVLSQNLEQAYSVYLSWQITLEMLNERSA